MKINIDDFREISITAKGKYQSRASKETLIDVLNEISLVYREAAENMERKGALSLARDYMEKSQMYYDICETAGAYEKYN